MTCADTHDIRLVGDSYQWEGRVEIFFSGTWCTITDSNKVVRRGLCSTRMRTSDVARHM